MRLRMVFGLLAWALWSGAAGAAVPGNLPDCTPGDGRVPVSAWHPTFTPAGDLATEPAFDEGDVLHVEFHRTNDALGCAVPDPQRLYSIEFPDPVGRDSGGVAVNWRGNTQYANGYCYISGFFIDQQVVGMHQGWTETYLQPLELAEVVASGRYCLAPASTDAAAGAAAAHPPVTTTAHDIPFTAARLRQWCDGNRVGAKEARHLLCNTYLHGFLDGDNTLVLARELPRTYCPPAGIAMADVAALFVRWLDERPPEYAALGAGLAVGAMLATHFPCAP